MFSREYIVASNNAAHLRSLWDRIDAAGGYFGDTISEVESEWTMEKLDELLHDCPWEIRDFLTDDRRPWEVNDQLYEYIREMYFSGDFADWPTAVVEDLIEKAEYELEQLGEEIEDEDEDSEA